MNNSAVVDNAALIIVAKRTDERLKGGLANKAQYL